MSDASAPDLYRVALRLTCEGIAGGPLVHLHLLVDPRRSEVFGSGTIGNSGTPPGTPQHPIPHVSGHIYHGGTPHDVTLVSLSGQYWLPGPPPTTVLTECTFTAALHLDPHWNGGGIFHYGPGGRQVCAKAKATPEKA
jgi:hypothetical protein